MALMGSGTSGNEHNIGGIWIVDALVVVDSLDVLRLGRHILVHLDSSPSDRESIISVKQRQTVGPFIDKTFCPFIRRIGGSVGRFL